MATIHAAASAVIDASPEAVYAIIADYRQGHPRILPERYFLGLEVERGGTGAGHRDTGSDAHARPEAHLPRGDYRARPRPRRERLAPPMLRRIYAEELRNLARVAGSAAGARASA